MTSLDGLAKAAAARQLAIMGGLHPEDLPGIATLILLGPLEPGFWPHFRCSPEYLDGEADPMDRWSQRVITDLADACGAQPFFPFGGPPFQPFIRWALASGRAWQSPVGLLVHDQAGLFVSYRGALGFAERLELPAPPANPCETCRDQPCRQACPVAALTPERYEVGACKAHISQAAGASCLTGGCLVRRACPLSQRYGRLAAQSEFHMRAFL